MRPSVLRAELLAAATTRGAVLAAAAAAVLVVIAAATSGDPVAAYGACAVALVLGAVMTAADYDHDTLCAALLATPARWPVLAAKLAIHGAFGLLLGLAALGVALLITGDVAHGGAAVPAAALAGAIGVAIGALARRRSIALAAAGAVIALVAGAAVAATTAALATLLALAATLPAAATLALTRRDVA